jgi:hypothetical protein
MKRLRPFVLLLAAWSSTAAQSQPKKSNPIPLNRDTTLVLWYSATGCTCAQWGDAKEQYYYLVPANDKLIQADTLWDGVTFPLKVKVTGKVISYSDVPKSYLGGKSKPDPGNVFRYTKILYKRKTP